MGKVFSQLSKVKNKLNDNFEILEIQGTAEKKPFSKEDLDKLFEITKPEIEKIITLQKD